MNTRIPDSDDPPGTPWELTVSECANLTGRSEQDIRFFIRRGKLRARKVWSIRRMVWMIDGLSLGNLVAQERPKRGRKHKTVPLSGEQRRDSLGFEPANPDRATDINQPDEPTSEGS